MIGDHLLAQFGSRARFEHGAFLANADSTPRMGKVNGNLVDLPPPIAKFPQIRVVFAAELVCVAQRWARMI